MSNDKPKNEGAAKAPIPGDMPSINEPPGSQVRPPEDPAGTDKPQPATKDVSHETVKHDDDDDEEDHHGHGGRHGRGGRSARR